MKEDARQRLKTFSEESQKLISQADEVLHGIWCRPDGTLDCRRNNRADRGGHESHG
jgi:hypothetical protein